MSSIAGATQVTFPVLGRALLSFPPSDPETGCLSWHWGQFHGSWHDWWFGISPNCLWPITGTFIHGLKMYMYMYNQAIWPPSIDNYFTSLIHPWPHIVMAGKSISDKCFREVFSEIRVGLSFQSLYAYNCVKIFTIRLLSWIHSQFTSTDQTIPSIVAAATISNQKVLDNRRLAPLSKMYGTPWRELAWV